MTKQEGRPFNEDELINQIGRMNKITRAKLSRLN